jgi:iron complex transport system permease protein
MVRTDLRPRRVLLALCTALAAAALLAITVGSVRVAPRRALAVLARGIQGDASDDPMAQVLLHIRLPRIVLAMAVGASLGLAGLASQTLFRNPLASPYVLGVSNGAALGSVVAMLLAGRWWGYGGVPLLSMLGGLAVGAAVFVLGRRSQRFGHTLLLAGIAVSAFCAALTAAALYLAGERLQTLVFWLMGGLWQATWRDVLLVAPTTLVALLCLVTFAPAMNVVLVGRRSAIDLGVNVRNLQVVLFLVITGTTSIAVAVTGVIGFVGLVVPHLLRILVGADHRGLVPASAAAGALLLLAADTLARTIAAPAEVPVGVLTALVGAPLFLSLLYRRAEYGA